VAEQLVIDDEKEPLLREVDVRELQQPERDIGGAPGGTALLEEPVRDDEVAGAGERRTGRRAECGARADGQRRIEERRRGNDLGRSDRRRRDPSG